MISIKFYTKSIAFISFFFLSVTFLYAQDNIYKAKRNALKIGVTPIPTKIFFSYEYAFKKQFSLGAMASYGGVNFPGYTCNIFTRYYSTSFNENGWFLEARASYGHYNPYVYADMDYPNYPYGTRDYVGKHRADIDYWNIGISGGYKAFVHERMFFEFIGGVHSGKVILGSDDTYFARYGIAYELGSDKVEEVFNNSGPGFPLHFVINFGVAF